MTIICELRRPTGRIRTAWSGSNVAQFRRQRVAASGSRLMPERIATYCFPPASNVIGGALKPDPTLIFHTWSEIVSS